MYVSVANGDVAEWHRDVCDNATTISRVEEMASRGMRRDGGGGGEKEGTSPSGTPFVGELAGMSRNAALEDERTRAASIARTAERCRDDARRISGGRKVGECEAWCAKASSTRARRFVSRAGDSIE